MWELAVVGVWVLRSEFRPELLWIIFKSWVRIEKKTQHFGITKINWLTLFKKIITVYDENYTKYINTKWRVLIVDLGGAYSYHRALNDYVWVLWDLSCCTEKLPAMTSRCVDLAALKMANAEQRTYRQLVGPGNYLH
jgi:hypothetical protein